VFSQLSGFASAFLAFPVTSRDASELIFSLATISANFSVPGIPETGITLIYRFGLLALRGVLLLTMRDAALDCGGF
jgi:hypothetical protein